MKNGKTCPTPFLQYWVDPVQLTLTLLANRPGSVSLEPNLVLFSAYPLITAYTPPFASFYFISLSSCILNSSLKLIGLGCIFIIHFSFNLQHGFQKVYLGFNVIYLSIYVFAYNLECKLGSNVNISVIYFIADRRMYNRLLCNSFRCMCACVRVCLPIMLTNLG